jgi:hypothetical protein
LALILAPSFFERQYHSDWSWSQEQSKNREMIIEVREWQNLTDCLCEKIMLPFEDAAVL